MEDKTGTDAILTGPQYSNLELNCSHPLGQRERDPRNIRPEGKSEVFPPRKVFGNTRPFPPPPDWIVALPEFRGTRPPMGRRGLGAIHSGSPKHLTSFGRYFPCPCPILHSPTPHSPPAPQVHGAPAVHGWLQPRWSGWCGADVGFMGKSRTRVGIRQVGRVALCHWDDVELNELSQGLSLWSERKRGVRTGRGGREHESQRRKDSTVHSSARANTIP